MRASWPLRPRTVLELASCSSPDAFDRSCIVSRSREALWLSRRHQANDPAAAFRHSNRSRPPRNPHLAPSLCLQIAFCGSPFLPAYPAVGPHSSFPTWVRSLLGMLAFCIGQPKTVSACFLPGGTVNLPYMHCPFGRAQARVLLYGDDVVDAARLLSVVHSFS